MPIELGQFLSQNASAPPGVPGTIGGGSFSQALNELVQQNQFDREQQRLEAQQQATAAHQQAEDALAQQKADALARKQKLDEEDAIRVELMEARRSGNKDKEEYASQKLARLGLAGALPDPMTLGITQAPLSPETQAALKGPEAAEAAPAVAPATSRQATRGDMAMYMGMPMSQVKNPDEDFYKKPEQHIALGDDGKAVSGMIEPGNINTRARPHVKNKDGSVSTVLSASYNIDGQEVLLPKISPDGKVLNDKQAIDLYKKTGQHLGIFDSPEAATAFAQQLHKDQESNPPEDTLTLGGATRPAAAPQSERAQRYGAAVRANFQAGIDNAGDEVEKRAATVGMQTALGALEDHTPEEAEKLGREAQKEVIGRYRGIKLPAAGGGGGGGGGPTKQQLAQQGQVADDAWKIYSGLAGQEDVKAAYNSYNKATELLNRLAPNKRTGLGDTSAMIELGYQWNHRAPAVREMDWIKGSAGMEGKMDALVNQYLGLGDKAGQQGQQIIKEMRELIAAGRASSKAKMDDFGSRARYAVNQMLLQGTPEQKKQLSDAVYNLAIGNVPKGPQSSSVDTKSDVADDDADEAVKEWMKSHGGSYGHQ